MRIIVVAIVLSSCLPKPQKEYTPDEVVSINDLKELMRVQAHHADPQFGKREQESFSDAEHADMAETGKMLQATSARIKGFAGKGELDDGFAKYAAELGQHAKALEDAGTAKDAAKVRGALESIRTTCKSCHGVYR